MDDWRDTIPASLIAAHLRLMRLEESIELAHMGGYAPPIEIVREWLMAKYGLN